MRCFFTMIYNADIKNVRAPKLELRSTLFKDGEVFRQQAEDISLDGKDASVGIPVEKTLVLDDTMGEGDYVLQVIVADKLPARPLRVAVQAIDIKIRK